MDAVEIADSLGNWSLEFVEAGSEELVRIPEEWRPVVQSADPGTRRRVALSLWNQDFLDLLPEFATLLTSRCVDVRACVTDDSPVLVYVLETDTGAHVSWVGYEPGSFDEPTFWEVFPEPLQVFLREVHAGFASGDPLAFGVTRPRYMQTLAEVAEFPDGIPGWEENAGISSTRLLQITTDGGILSYCLSPDIGPGQIALVYEGDIDPMDFGRELDRLMMSRYQLQS